MFCSGGPGTTKPCFTPERTIPKKSSENEGSHVEGSQNHGSQMMGSHNDGSHVEGSQTMGSHNDGSHMTGFSNNRVLKARVPMCPVLKRGFSNEGSQLNHDLSNIKQ